MTQRSPNPHQPKTTTISRRLRDRADQNLSVQPPEIPQIRGARSCRAANLQTPRHNPIDYQTPGSHPPSLTWNTSHLLEDIPKSHPSQPAPSDQSQFQDTALAQTIDFFPLDSRHDSRLGPVSTAGHPTPRTNHIHPTQSLDLLPSPSLSTSSRHSSKVEPSTDLEQSHDPLLELQDMRYATPPVVRRAVSHIDSTLGFMMPPSQYGMNNYGSSQTSYSSGYPSTQSYAEPRSSAPGPYGSTYSSSPAPNDHQPRRTDQHTVLPPYPPQHPSLPRTTYQQPPPSDPMRANVNPMASAAHSYTYQPPHNHVSNQSLGGSAYPP